ncbi:zinc finger protein 226 [Trichonephila clavipes]|nr:zinc finger protein 226 [Trichonephila clavipes]
MSQSETHPSQEDFEYLCDECRERRKKHTRNHRVSSLESCFECKFCNKSFSMGFMTKKIELRNNKSKRPLTCEECKKTFKTRLFLKYHSFEHNNEWPCWCLTCKKGFVAPYFLEAHMRVHNDDLKFECSLCPMKFSSQCNLKKHRFSHSGVLKNCDVCSQGFKFESNLKDHILRHIKKEEIEFHCTRCNSAFKCQSDMDEHNQLHFNKFKWKCEVCSKKFMCEKILKMHICCNHQKQQFQCSDCDFKTKYESRLDKHSLTHAGIFAHKCEICSKGFEHKPELKTHIIRYHTKERKFECNNCGLKFKWESSLKTHNIMHTGEGKYKCDICSKSFGYASVLKVHMKTHRKDNHDDRQLQCSDSTECSKLRNRLKTRDSQTNNILANSEEAVDDPAPKHTETPSFQCVLCNYECESEAILEQHKQMYHQTIMMLVADPDNNVLLHSGYLVAQTIHVLAHSGETVADPTPEFTGTQSLTCDVCGYECESEEFLEQHKQMNHQTSQTIHTNLEGMA